MNTACSENSQPVLKLTAATVSVRSVDLIHDINLTVNAGEIVAVVGPNGAGKSTLLRAIAGDAILHQGEISVCGQPQAAWHLQARARHLAVLPQFSLLNFPYSAEDVVALSRIPHCTGLAVDRKIVHQAMQTMDIEYLQGRLYTQLSGGEKQRTQLARVMAQIWRQEDAAKRLLLLDEPSTALDLGHQQQLMQAVVDFARQGVGVLMVVHDINLATQYADRILALAFGRSVGLGSANEMISEALLYNLFGAKTHLVHHPLTNKVFVVS